MTTEIFRDDFDFFDPLKWIVRGNHPNCKIEVKDGWLRLINGWKIPPDIPHEDDIFYRVNNEEWFGVCTREPLNLIDTKIEVEVNMVPLAREPFLPTMYYYGIGFVVANKIIESGVSLLGDPELIAYILYLESIMGVPIQVLAATWRGMSYPSRYFGRILYKFPPTKIGAEVTKDKITFYESGMPISEFPASFDFSKAHIYLLLPNPKEYSYGGEQHLIPEAGMFNYISVQKLAPVEIPAAPILTSASFLLLFNVMLMLNLSVLIRAMGLMK